MSPRVTRAQQLRADVSEVAHESFEAALIVKSPGPRGPGGRALRRGDRTSCATPTSRSVARRGTFDPAIEAIPTIGTLAVLAVGTCRVAAGQITAAEVVQIAYLFSILAFPVRALGWVLAELPRDGRRVGPRLTPSCSATRRHDLRRPRRARAGAAPATQAAGRRLRLRGQPRGRRRDRAQARGLSGVTLDVPAGGTMALVGPTGSGKSTLTNLVVRLVDPDSGEVRSTASTCARSAAAAFARSPRWCRSRPSCSTTPSAATSPSDRARPTTSVWAALRVAQGDGFVAPLPAGLDTRVGERGASLSGGQRQRIALARAVIRAPAAARPRRRHLSAVDPSVEQADPRRAARRPAAGRPCSSSPTGWPPSRSPTTSSTSRRGGSSTTAPTTSCSAAATGYQRLVTAYAREAAERAAVAADEEPERPSAWGRRDEHAFRTGRSTTPASSRARSRSHLGRRCRRGVELSPELRRGIGVTLALARRCRRWASCSSRSSSSAPPTRASSPRAVPTPGSCCATSLLAMVGVAVTALSRRTSSTSACSRRRRTACRPCGSRRSGTSTTCRC